MSSNNGFSQIYMYYDMKYGYILLLCFFLASCTKPINYYGLSGEVHGTFYHITYAASSKIVDEDDLKEVFSRFDRSLSTFDSLSVISRINQNDSSVVLDSLFTKVFTRGMEISKMTNGAFDMTVAPLVNCWGFGFLKKEDVTATMIDSILQFVGYEKVKLENGHIVKQDERTMLDASAIAKGYSCDVTADFLRSKGIENYMVEIGGEIVTRGKNKHGKNWTIGITKPKEGVQIDDMEIQEVLCMSDKAMATSGNYRQFYYKDGKRYSHTINPSTGYPAEKSILSATVVADDCMTADAFATAFMVMGIEKSVEYSEANGMCAYFIYSDEENQLRVKATDAFSSFKCPEN